MPTTTKPPRRANGAGSITKQADGTFRVRVTIGTSPDGRQRQRERTARTLKEARDIQRELENARDAGTLLDADKDRLTVDVFLQRWLMATKSTVRESTWHRYAEYVNVHLAPTLGRIRLRSLRPDAIQALYAAKQADGKAPQTIQHVHRVLHRACHQGVRWGYLVANPVDRVDPPRVPHIERSVPTVDELRALLASSHGADGHWYPLWSTAINSGCRMGELLGLKWGDVDLRAGALTIRRALTNARGCVPSLAEPKTARSRRRIALPAEAVAALREHRTRQLEQRLTLGADYAVHDLVFATHTGAPLGSRNVLRVFKAALVRAGLPTRFRFHDLRHAHATALLAAHVDLKTVSARLGHASIALTANTYSHAVPQLDADAAARLDAVLSRSVEVS